MLAIFLIAGLHKPGCILGLADEWAWHFQVPNALTPRLRKKILLGLALAMTVECCRIGVFMTFLCLYTITGLHLPCSLPEQAMEGPAGVLTLLLLVRHLCDPDWLSNELLAVLCCRIILADDSASVRRSRSRAVFRRMIAVGAAGHHHRQSKRRASKYGSNRIQPWAPNTAWQHATAFSDLHFELTFRFTKTQFFHALCPALQLPPFFRVHG